MSNPVIFSYPSVDNNQIGKSPLTPVTEIENFNSSCQHWEFVGDGYCDDEANNEICYYDLNDCCKMDTDKTQCSNCTCLITKDEAETIQLEFENEFCPKNESGVSVFARSYMLGDGNCQLNLNKGKFYLSNTVPAIKLCLALPL